MTRFLFLTVALVCAIAGSGCANFARPSVPVTVTPPRREMPESARRPCRLPVLPDELTVDTVEQTLVHAGVALVKCDIARQTAVDVHDGEHADEDDWLRELGVEP